MKLKHFLIITVLFLLSSNITTAQTDKLIRKYSFDTLNKLWQNLIVQDKGVQVEWYQKVLLGETQQEVKLSESQSRIAGVWTDLKSPDQEQKARFFVMTLPSDYVAAIMRREVALNFYLNREAYYEAARQPEGTIKEKLEYQNEITRRQNVLTERRVKAHLELFLINLIRYREAPTLAAKCTYLTRAATSGNIFRQGDENHDLAKIAKEAAMIYENALRERSECKVKSYTSTANIKQLIEQKANEKLIKRLEEQKNTVIKAIAEAQVPMKSMEKEVKVPTESSTLLKLEKNMGNASANLEFVHQDGMNLEDIVKKITTLDFAKTIRQIDKDFVPREVRLVKKANQDLQAKILRLMKTLEKIPLKACKNLSDRFENIFTGTLSTTGAKDTALVELDQCLIATGAYIQRLLAQNKANPLEQESIIFATHLEQLSEAMLRRLSNP